MTSKKDGFPSIYQPPLFSWEAKRRNGQGKSAAGAVFDKSNDIAEKDIKHDGVQIMKICGEHKTW